MHDGLVSILHVSDLHIPRRASPRDLLRRGNIKYFFSGLFQVLEPRLRERKPHVDVVAITGDFVHQGAVDRFENSVAEVVNELTRQFGVPPKRVVLCPGNHDIERELDRSGKAARARRAYSQFAAGFANGSPWCANQRACLVKLQRGLWALAVDATLGSGGSDRPGELRVRELDEITGWVVEYVQESDTLLVLSHYPVDLTVAEPVASQLDAAWIARHVWTNGLLLKTQLLSVRPHAPTLWLTGDVHFKHTRLERGHAFLSGGRLGTTATRGNQTPARRHARLIEVANNRDIRWLGAELDAGVYQEEAAGAQWLSAGEGRGVLGAGEAGTSTSAMPGLATVAPASSAHVPVHEFGNDLADEIVKTIADRRLYHLGRFPTSANEVSLGWVSIGPLLNEKQLFGVIASRMAERVSMRARELNVLESRAIVVGLDSWGAALAGQITLMTGIPGAFIAARARGKNAVPEERLDVSLKRRICRARLVIIVSDVVATGESLVHVRKASGSTACWMALSVLCDSEQKRVAECAFLSEIHTACARLRLPVLNVSALPDEGVLRTTLRVN